MKIDPVAQESTPASFAGANAGTTAGATLATPQALEDEVAGEEAGLRILSRLSYCVAWLFGLEAFFMEPEAAAGAQAVQGFEGRRRD
ncbi:energy-converting hydrogenase Eha subunit G [Paraburkholderia bannensis]|uniref:Energy-converting hydrogenase Eha subunit G n=1 Tax=Paraburkholderia bannensis TaxID=765414 RepID=A0A7W9WSE6_9BURK|nr:MULTISPECIES: hypothetical protein [Paraburkholderia]MBB3257413.1 energy-converting hydrogenase Eha subunit G [Paraburkholderia sp. WP4_3_2]MBB6102191.1 energy-converting hydrogenase Eha subunit G [Paraburkholderia bannensis]